MATEDMMENTGVEEGTEKGLFESYFPDLNTDPYPDNKTEREYFLRFIDMICLLAVNQKENAPGWSVDRVGALLSDVDLVQALEPHEKEEFQDMAIVRDIFRILVIKGKNALEQNYSEEEGKLFPISDLMFSGYLTTLETLAVLLALASSLNRKYERIFGILQEEKEGILRPTFGLCRDLSRIFLTEEENDISALLNQDTFLNRVLLSPWPNGRGDSEMSRPLRLRPPALLFLYGTRGTLGELDCCCSYDIPGEDSYNCHEETENELLHVYRSVMASNVDCVIELSGEAGSGKQFLMRRLCRSTGQPLLTVQMKTLLSFSPETQESIVAGVLVKAALEDTLLYLAGMPEHRDSRAPIERIFSQLSAVLSVILVGTEKQLPEAFYEGRKGSVYRIAMPSVDQIAQQNLWAVAAEENEAVFDEGISVNELVSKYTMNPGRIFEAVRNTASLSNPREADGRMILKKEQLEEQIRRICSAQFGENAKRLSSPFTWEDLIVEPESEKLLRLACDRVLYRSVVNEDYGFGKKLPYGRGIAIVLYGPPGTGKTMAAQVVAKELGLDIYRIDLSQISSKYIGETEKNLGTLFDAAKNSNAILFFDEADSLFAKRTAVTNANDKHANAETAYLLQKIEEYSGVSILATNNMQNFDAAFKRRMTYLISIGIPDEETRRMLWEKAFPENAPLARDVDFEILSKALEISGSAIKASAISAAYRAAARGGSITMLDIAEALELECMKNGKMGAKNDVLQAMSFQ